MPRDAGRSRLVVGAAIVAAACVLAAPAQTRVDAAVREERLPRLVPPPDGFAHFGFTYRLWESSDPQVGDSRPFADRIRASIAEELAGKTPTFLNVWAGWQQPDLSGKPFVPFSASRAWIDAVSPTVGDAGVVYLDWNLTSTTPGNEGITTHEIARGLADRYIRAYARDVKAYGRPLLVRLFNGEFNGDWWYGVSPRANSNVTTGDFVAAWRRVVDIFRAVGATNVSWAWVPMAYPANVRINVDPNIAAYYPGDAYVDWAGADVADTGRPDWLDGPYAFAAAHGKPFFVGEFAIRHEWSTLSPPQQLVWLAEAFDYFERHPLVKAISYFNYNSRAPGSRVPWDAARAVSREGGRVWYLPDVNDHDSRLIAAGPAAQALFASRLAAPRYVGPVATEQVDGTPQPAALALLAPTFSRGVAVVRWRGNLAADTYDLQSRTARTAWRTLARAAPATSFRLRGAAGRRVFVRVRARDVWGTAGGWSAPRTIELRRP
jgi:hypothetical protein